MDFKHYPSFIAQASMRALAQYSMQPLGKIGRTDPFWEGIDPGFIAGCGQKSQQPLAGTDAPAWSCSR
jgi:hypothetical protein